MAWLARFVGMYAFNYIRARLAAKATKMAIQKVETYMKNKVKQDKTSTAKK